MINNKGKDFATKYWTTVVHQEAFNSLKDMKNTYGQKGDDNWEYIALAEGWANFRQYKMCKKYLKYNSISKVHESNADGYYNESPADNKKDIFYRYAGLMTELHNIITDVNFEHVISKSSSIREFEEHLLNLYLDNKYISNQLNKAFNKYEALN